MLLLRDLIISVGKKILCCDNGWQCVVFAKWWIVTEHVRPMCLVDMLSVTRKELKESDWWCKWRSLGRAVSKLAPPIRTPFTCRVVWQKPRWIMRDSSSGNCVWTILSVETRWKGSAFSQTAGSEICQYGNVSLDLMKPDPSKKLSTNIRWLL
jgi:hypothetical protein